MQYIFTLLALFSTSPGIASTEANRSDLPVLTGLKFPNSAEEGIDPVAVSVMAVDENAGGFTELLPYVLRAPDQDEAGSCLYMSLTGIAEWWQARLHPELARTPDGPLDLSERYMMNIAGYEEDQNGIANWKTDSILLFNRAGGSLLNSGYRFTKGWYVRDRSGNLQASHRGAPGASYGTSYNWIDHRDSVARQPLQKLPLFQREVLFADPESNQWNTGVMPADIVERIKTALREKKAPVHIIYNHFGYWHATVILGYNDEQDNKNCNFVRRFMDHMGTQAADYRAKAAQTKDPTERERLLKLAAKAGWALNNTKRGWERGGGCHPKGVFYVRDSIYADPAGPKYDYDPSQTGDEEPYVKTTVMLEYDWVRYMANHAVQITVR